MKTYTIGLDIGGTSSKFGIVDSQGNILEQGRMETCRNADPLDFVQRIAQVLLPLIERYGRKDFKGIGIGAPNGNFYSGCIELAPNLQWKGIVPMQKMLAEALSLPAILTNDANAAAMGEMIFGGAKGMKDFIIITLGTGLGSGIVVDGKILYGKSGIAAEMGQLIVEKDGRLCGCGRRGCLETYASATGIVKTVSLALEKGEKSSLAGVSPLTSAQITIAAEAGDKLALRSFEETGEILGLALANAVAFSSPEAIFLFGGLAHAGEFIIGPTRKAFEENLHNIYQGTVRLLPSSLVDADAAILGASALLY